MGIVIQYLRGQAANPDGIAIVDGKRSIDYSTLGENAARLGGQLSTHLGEGRVGVLASRSIETCCAFLGTAWAGGTYVPLGLNHPDDRLIALFEHLELDALIVDASGLKKLSPAVLAAAPKLVLVPEEAPGTFKQHEASAPVDFAEPLKEPVDKGPDHLAYIVFTSGTTGMPKGVMVNNRSIGLYMDAIAPLYALQIDDRAAETCESNFDLSIHNMLTTWRVGATLYIMRPLDLVAPTRFINKHQITTWLSVPSIISLARQSGTLLPNSMPSLRLTWFCGEPLSQSAVRDWQEAAPNSTIDNFYGPTEITVATLVQRWNGNGPVTGERGIVAIGQAIDGTGVFIADEEGNPVADGTVGEIVLHGVQCSNGYFKRPDLTAEVFKPVNGERGYFTGDLGYRDTHGTFHHMGRKDNQIKYRGHRIELEEIDAKLRHSTGAEMVGTVTWPRDGDVVEGFAGFYSVPGLSADEVREKMRAVLPQYMVPAILENLEEMPLSANGKVDRKALIAMLDARAANAGELTPKALAAE